MTDRRLLFRNHNAYYQPLADHALRDFGVSRDFRNSAKHTLTTADLSNQLGRNATLLLGDGLEWQQYLTPFGRDSIFQKGHTKASQESYKDRTANLIGAHIDAYLTKTYGDVSVKTRAQAVAIAAKDGLIPKDYNHAAALRKTNLIQRIEESSE